MTLGSFTCAGDEVPQLGQAQPLLRVVAIIQDRIHHLDHQRSKYRDGGKSAKEDDQHRYNAVKYEELTQILEFAWDLCKQIMGIAVLSDNEAKKQARKENAIRKNQDVELVQRVLSVIDCLERLADPVARTDFLNGTGGATRIEREDLDLLDELYPRVTPKRQDEADGRLYDQSLDAARHLVSIVDGSPDEFIGTTYAHLKEVVDTVEGCGYLEAPKEAPVPEPEPVPAPEEHVLEETAEEVVFVPLEVADVPPVIPAAPLISHQVPQNVPAPGFPVLSTPVTLQQVEHAYFAQQYGHPKLNGAPPVAEVFGPQNFIFLQESEIETPETVRQTSPCPVSPASIPSQTFTNQNFSLPPQHFNPEIPNGPPRVPLEEMPPVAHYPDPHVPGFPSVAVPIHANLPPPHMSIPPVHPQMSTYRHPVPYEPAEPVIAPEVPKPCEISNDADYSEWADTNNDHPQDRVTEPLEINQWNPADGEGGDSGRSRSDDKYRQKRRGGGNGPGGNHPGGYRPRGNYQNGRGSYYRNEGHHSKMNGDSENNDRESGYRYDNPKNNYRDNGFKSRGPGRMNNGSHQTNGRSRDNRGPPRPSQSQNGTSKPYYAKRQGNGQFESRPEGKQQFTQ